MQAPSITLHSVYDPVPLCQSLDPVFLYLFLQGSLCTLSFMPSINALQPFEHSWKQGAGHTFFMHIFVMQLGTRRPDLSLPSRYLLSIYYMPVAWELPANGTQYLPSRGSGWNEEQWVEAIIIQREDYSTPLKCFSWDI